MCSLKTIRPPPHPPTIVNCPHKSLCDAPALLPSAPMDDTSYSTVPRHMPDVPEDVDFLLDHLNDPNLDLKQVYAVRSFKEKEKPSKSLYDRSEVDAESRYESDRYSTSRADSRASAAIDFEESVSPFLSPPHLT
jgi:hypothetical protein